MSRDDVTSFIREFARFTMAARSISMLGRFSPLFKRAARQIVSILRPEMSPNLTARTYASSAESRERKRKVSQKTSRMELHPKVVIQNLYQAVTNRFKNTKLNPDVRTEFLTDKTRPGPGRWKTTLCLKWPQFFVAEGLGKNKSESEVIAYNKAIEQLKKLKILSPQNEPQIVDVDEIKHFLIAQKAPFLIKLENQIENRISHLLNRYEDIKDDVLRISETRLNGANKRHILDAITGQRLLQTNDAEITERNWQLLRKWEKLQNPDSVPSLQIRQLRQNLPIYNQRQQILDLIRDHKVIVLSGETGCGKSTQVPQYILDSFCQSEKGSECNVIVTQPRRISAISIAGRVARERNESLGDTIGFQVRLASAIPRQKGAVLFCSSGILLRRLQSNPNLEGISHVILDEAHERDILTDFLLVLLRDIIRRGSPIKLILMSASINAATLTKYFDSCPIIHVPGRLFPVKDYYLDDVIKLTRKTCKRITPAALITNPADLDVDFVAHVIASIDSTRPPGAILCFLPGWQDIQAVHTQLLRLLPNKYARSIFPLHSRVSQEQQSLIFDKSPSGTRKIILATNIAETSITIDDVVYVVDCGRLRETVFDPDWGTTSLRTKWVTKANVTQRKGRAGRVSPGECYHLFPQEFMSKMDDFPLPEIQRVSLEKVVLDAKVHSGTKESVHDFLSRCPDSPSSDTVQSAIKDLIKRRFLNDDESLSLLGRCAVTFSSHPYISKALIYSSWLKCLQPVLSVSSFLTGGKDVFVKTTDNKSIIRTIKKKFADGSSSDHVSFANLFDALKSVEAEGGFVDKQNFCNNNLIHRKNIDFVEGLRGILTDHLLEVGLLSTTDDCQRQNANGSHRPTVLAALCAGFEPNFVRCLRGEVSKKKINKSAVVYRESDGRVMFSSDSINYAKKEVLNENIPRWFTYFLKTSSADSGLRVVRDSSPAPPLALLLFSGRNVKTSRMSANETSVNGTSDVDSTILSVDGSKLNTFCCTNKQASLLLKLRSMIDSFFSAHLLKRDGINLADPVEFGNVEKELMEVLKQLFEIKATNIP